MTEYRLPKEISKFLATIPKKDFFKTYSSYTALDFTLMDISSGTFYCMYVDHKATTYKKYCNKAYHITLPWQLSSKAKRLRNRHKRHYPELFI